jgi:16S rRNA (guanine966-N2)-methyltransferase
VAPRGEATRPTSDRLRAAIFNVLEARGAPLDGARVLDLFAGTGALGLEALSRGAARATFVESAAPAAAAVERNVASVGAADRAAVLRADWRHALDRLARTGARFDLILLDPPYASRLAAAVVEVVGAGGLAAAPAVIVAEHAAGEAMPDAAGPFGLWLSRAYGRTAITLYGTEGLH